MMRDVKVKYLAGGQWKAKSIGKKTKQSQTPGNKKGLVPPPWARYMARSNRSYKHPDYAKWDALCTGNKIQWANKG